MFACTADTCENEEQMLKWHDSLVRQGYEGIILRNLKGLNIFGDRTVDLMKYKVRLDDEYAVVEFVKDKNGCAIPVCEVIIHMDEWASNDVIKTFKAPLIGSREFQKQVWAEYEDNNFEVPDKYADLTVEYEKLSKYFIPSKPKGKCFREVVNGEVQS